MTDREALDKLENLVSLGLRSCGLAKVANTPESESDSEYASLLLQMDTYFKLRTPRPVVVCLCGSTRFWKEFQEASLRETLAGKVVLSIGGAFSADGEDRTFRGYVPHGEYDVVKARLDALHFRKIEMADEVLILNKGGYIGRSTRNELNYALALHKKVRFLEELDFPGE